MDRSFLVDRAAAGGAVSAQTSRCAPLVSAHGRGGRLNKGFKVAGAIADLPQPVQKQIVSDHGANVPGFSDQRDPVPHQKGGLIERYRQGFQSGGIDTAVIVDHAEKNGFDHIIVGNPRLGVARLVLGSVAAEVAAKAHCSVTIAR
jgi:hypothetical protein